METQLDVIIIGTGTAALAAASEVKKYTFVASP
jgi:succinate dehydrogenase/fumarate reductase flavoprotein subunit